MIMCVASFKLQYVLPEAIARGHYWSRQCNVGQSWRTFSPVYFAWRQRKWANDKYL